MTLIPDEQFGHQLTRLMEYVTSGFEKKMTTIAVFLNISKLYDSMWDTVLIYKLVSMNVPGELMRGIDSFLAQRSFRVKMDGVFSCWRPMLSGVPQGSLFSPLLYKLYISDIPKSIVT
jgi:Reverse transcriptase (RNA-dependent DNA polymerase).